MTAHNVQQVDRRGFVRLVGVGVLALLGARLVGAVDVPMLGTVDTGTQHARAKHGHADVAAVLDALRALTFAEGARFREQGPCRDGRWRLIVPQVDATHDGIVILEALGPSYFRLITAFKFGAQSNYGRNVMDDCHGPEGLATAA